MEFVTHSHRFAEPIIASDELLSRRYKEFISAIENISEEELIRDFMNRQIRCKARERKVKSLTPSINALLKERMSNIEGWQSEVDIFNDETGQINNTEWRLDFACENAFCVEVAFNHGEAITWNLIKPVLACELNHVRKAVQGRLGIYVCATDALKINANIDSASGSYEKVLRYLPPLMNQLTIPIMIIGLQPLKKYKISKDRRVIGRFRGMDERWLNKKVVITLNDYSQVCGRIVEQDVSWNDSMKFNSITVSAAKTKKQIRTVAMGDIRFLELA